MSDYGYPTTRRYPRDLQSAFGPYTSREIHEPRPKPQWLAWTIAVALLLWFAAVMLKHGPLG